MLKVVYHINGIFPHSWDIRSHSASFCLLLSIETSDRTWTCRKIAEEYFSAHPHGKEETKYHDTSCMVHYKPRRENISIEKTKCCHAIKKRTEYKNTHAPNKWWFTPKLNGITNPLCFFSLIELFWSSLFKRWL